MFVNGVGEEAGWRGYVLPLLRRRHSLLRSSLLLVPIWACWHLLLFFLLKNYRDLGLIGIPGFLVGLACGSIVLAWLYETAHSSILIVAVWRGTYNVTAATSGAHGTVAAVVSTGVMFGAAAIAWQCHRRGPHPAHLLEEFANTDEPNFPNIAEKVESDDGFGPLSGRGTAALSR